MAAVGRGAFAEAGGGAFAAVGGGAFAVAGGGVALAVAGGKAFAATNSCVGVAVVVMGAFAAAGKGDTVGRTLAAAGGGPFAETGGTAFAAARVAAGDGAGLVVARGSAGLAAAGSAEWAAAGGSAELAAAGAVLAAAGGSAESAATAVSDELAADGGDAAAVAAVDAGLTASADGTAIEDAVALSAAGGGCGGGGGGGSEAVAASFAADSPSAQSAAVDGAGDISSSPAPATAAGSLTAGRGRSQRELSRALQPPLRPTSERPLPAAGLRLFSGSRVGGRPAILPAPPSWLLAGNAPGYRRGKREMRASALGNGSSVEGRGRRGRTLAKLGGSLSSPRADRPRVGGGGGGGRSGVCVDTLPPRLVGMRRWRRRRSAAPLQLAGTVQPLAQPLELALVEPEHGRRLARAGEGVDGHTPPRRRALLPAAHVHECIRMRIRLRVCARAYGLPRPRLHTRQSKAGGHPHLYVHARAHIR